MVLDDVNMINLPSKWTPLFLDLISSKGHTIDFIFTNNLPFYQLPIIPSIFLVFLVPGLQESSPTPKPRMYCFFYLFTDPCSPLILIYPLSQMKFCGQSLYLLPCIQSQFSCLSLILLCSFVLKHN